MRNNSFNTTIILLTSLFMLLFNGKLVQAQTGPVLTVAEIVWTDGVTDDKNPLNTYANGSTVSVSKPLFLWIKVRGEQKAFDSLKKKRSLTIEHKWTYNYLGWHTDRIDVSIGRNPPIDDDTLEKLAQELEVNGYFDWRTWSKKERLVPGEYSVICVDGFDQPLSCSQAESCHKTIHLAQ